MPGESGHPRRGSHESGLRVSASGTGAGPGPGGQQRKGGGALTPLSPDGSSIYGTPLGTTPATTPIDGPREGGFAYKKDDVDDTLFVGVAKKTSRRNSRNERRNSKVQSLPSASLTNDVIGSFFPLTRPRC